MIIDCFMYGGERDALKIRLNELNDIVDKFIIVEGMYDFRGNPKPVDIEEIWDDLEPWHDRIHKVIVQVYPATEDPWEREHFQRDQITRGLNEIDAPQDARLIVSDADEIPRASAVTKVNIYGGVVHLDMNSYYFYLDWKVPDRWNQGGRPFVVTRKQMGSPQAMRDKVKRIALDGAWHFSYLGGPETVSKKIGSFSHTEYDTPEYNDLIHLQHCSRVGLDPFERFKLEPVEVDDTYPQWVLDNREELQHLFRSGVQ